MVNIMCVYVCDYQKCVWFEALSLFSVDVERWEKGMREKERKR